MGLSYKDVLHPMLLAFKFCALALRMEWPLVPMLIGYIGISSPLRHPHHPCGSPLLRPRRGPSQETRRAAKGISECENPPFVTGIAVLVAILAIAGVATPVVFERWSERLFNAVGGGQSSADLSALTRFAETKAFLTLLNAEPATYLYGRGLGFTYYWDVSFVPDLAQYTYGNEDEFRSYCAGVNFPGPSIWIYAMFSGGVLGLGFYAGLFGFGTYWADRSVRHLPTVPSYPLDVAFLPFVSLIGFLSLSLTFNPFIERASAITIGVVLTFPQFLIMAAWRKSRA